MHPLFPSCSSNPPVSYEGFSPLNGCCYRSFLATGRAPGLTEPGSPAPVSIVTDDFIYRLPVIDCPVNCFVASLSVSGKKHTPGNGHRINSGSPRTNPVLSICRFFITFPPTILFYEIRLETTTINMNYFPFDFPIITKTIKITLRMITNNCACPFFPTLFYVNDFLTR